MGIFSKSRDRDRDQYGSIEDRQAREDAREALAMAAQAKSDLARHDAVCTERWSDAKLALTELSDSVSSLNKLVVGLVLTCAGVLIVGLASLVVTLLLKQH